jgi:hypothetical protein
MLKPWSRRILQIVGALALVVLLVIVCRRTDWSKGFTPDGALTLIAGVIAFIAVIIQIASSSKRVQDQIRAQRDAEREEQERQRKGLAIGLLFEIDGFYRSYLRDPRKVFDRVDAGKDNLPGVRSIGENPFPVYVGNASRIGELKDHNVQAVVHFYGEANSFLSIMRDYRNALDILDRGSVFVIPLTRQGSQDLSRFGWEAQARADLGQMKKALPELVRFAWLVCYHLCMATGTEFEFPVIGVAAEPISIEDFEASTNNGMSVDQQSAKLKS